MATKLARLCATLHRQLVAEEEAEIARGHIDDEPYFRTRPYPPATEAAIKAHEKRTGFALPPSYRAFLRIHNGWYKVNGGDVAILGVSGPGYDKPNNAINKHEKRTPKQVFDGEVALSERSWKRKANRQEAEELRQQDARGEAIYFPNHPPVAVNYNAGVFVFDRHHPGKRGEYPVVPIRYGTAEDHSWPSFTAFLEHWVRITARRRERG